MSDGKNLDFLGQMGVSRSNYVRLGHTWSKWFKLALNFTYWANRIKVDQNGSNCIKNGQIWFDLVKLDQKGQIWTLLVNMVNF